MELTYIKAIPLGLTSALERLELDHGVEHSNLGLRWIQDQPLNKPNEKFRLTLQ